MAGLNKGQTCTAIGSCFACKSLAFAKNAQPSAPLRDTRSECTEWGMCWGLELT